MKLIDVCADLRVLVFDYWPIWAVAVLAVLLALKFPPKNNA